MLINITSNEVTIMFKTCLLHGIVARVNNAACGQLGSFVLSIQ